MGDSIVGITEKDEDSKQANHCSRLVPNRMEAPGSSKEKHLCLGIFLSLLGSRSSDLMEM